MSDKIFVIAGHASESSAYIKRKLTERFEHCVRNDLVFTGSMSDYVYVSGVDTLRGHSEVHGVFVGSFRLRSDIKDIVRQIRLINKLPTNEQIIPDMFVGRGMAPQPAQPYNQHLIVHIEGATTKDFIATKSGDTVVVEFFTPPQAGLTITVTTIKGTAMAWVGDGFTYKFTFFEHVATPQPVSVP